MLFQYLLVLIFVKFAVILEFVLILGSILCLHFFFFFLFFFLLGRAVLVEYGGSQARAPVRAVTAGLCQNHSNMGSEPRLQPTPQLTAMTNP